MIYDIYKCVVISNSLLFVTQRTQVARPDVCAVYCYIYTDAHGTQKHLHEHRSTQAQICMGVQCLYICLS